MSDRPIRIALIGIGKIARDQHLPALRENGAFELAATVSLHGGIEAVPTFTDIESMLEARVPLDAVAICTPPAVRYALARAALDTGLHVMLEKPPGTSVSEVSDLAARAHKAGVTLFAAWHSREAAGVEPARAWLAERTVKSVRASWKEDIRVWHPGQRWILEPGGFGVFDPGINALSLLTRILPRRLRLCAATLHFPANQQAPIAAELDLLHGDGAPASATFDFLQTGPQRWDIEVETDRGQLLLSDGGQKLRIDGVDQNLGGSREYPRLYSRFATLIANRQSDVDVTPLQLVADAFMLGRRDETAPFEF